MKFNDIDKWLLTSLNSTILGVESSFANYKYNEASKFVYEFFWNDFCDWYIEISKIDLNNENVDIQNMAISKLLFFLKKSLLILHPFIPFVTEKIYSEFAEKGRYFSFKMNIQILILPIIFKKNLKFLKY